MTFSIVCDISDQAIPGEEEQRTADCDQTFLKLGVTGVPRGRNMAWHSQCALMSTFLSISAVSHRTQLLKIALCLCPDTVMFCASVLGGSCARVLVIKGHIFWPDVARNAFPHFVGSGTRAFIARNSSLSGPNASIERVRSRTPSLLGLLCSLPENAIVSRTFCPSSSLLKLVRQWIHFPSFQHIQRVKALHGAACRAARSC